MRRIRSRRRRRRRIRMVGSIKKIGV